MASILVNQLRKDIRQEVLFEIESLAIHPGDKIGLVGRNGAGKSTLLRILTGEDQDYKGEVSLGSDFAFVAQFHDQLAQSGGEAKLAALREAFRQKSPLLILDEPSANLDAGHQDWLIRQLQRYRGTLILVSHDRHLLDACTTDTLFLEKQRLSVYPGPYTEAMVIKEQEFEQQTKLYQEADKTIKRLRQEAEKKKSKADKMLKRKKTVSASDWKVNSKVGAYDGKAKALAKSAKGLEKRIAGLSEVKKPRKEQTYALRIPETALKKGTLIRLREGFCQVADQFLFSFDHFVIKSGDKVALTGSNGAGKTSFVRQLVRQELEGYYAQNLKVAYFSQNLDILQPDKTLIENVASTSSHSMVDNLNCLAMVGLPYQLKDVKVRQLSQGQQVKALLIKTLLSQADLYILDEPTNFLDLPILLNLEKFLENFKGTCLMISHDQAFLQAVTDRTYQITSGFLEER